MKMKTALTPIAFRLCLIAAVVAWTVSSAQADSLSYITGFGNFGAATQGAGNISGFSIPASSSVLFEKGPDHAAYTSPIPGLNSDATADAYMSANLSHGSFHASAYTAASINNTSSFGNTARGLAELHIQAFDLLRFSSTLPPGTDIAFEVTLTLHSILDTSYVPSNCGTTSANATYAYINLDGSFQPNGSATLGHTSCGNGSEFMTSTTVRHATVGTDYMLVTGFGIQADSGISGRFADSEHANVDASHTGSVHINVLTPGVTFTSDSGATYAPPVSTVPEPSTLLLLIPGLGGIVLLRNRFPIPRLSGFRPR